MQGIRIWFNLLTGQEGEQRFRVVQGPNRRVHSLSWKVEEVEGGSAVDEGDWAGICVVGKTQAISTPWAFFIEFSIPKGYHQPFVEWYRAEHLPLLLNCHDWRAGALYRASRPGAVDFVAVHQLSTLEALDSPERRQARATPQWRWWTQFDWFDRPFRRWILQAVTS